MDENVFETPTVNVATSENESASASETSTATDGQALSTSFPQTPMRKIKPSHCTQSRRLESWVEMRMLEVMMIVMKRGVMTRAFQL